MTAVEEEASRLMEVLPETLPVTQALKERFEAQGYLAFDKVTSEADLANIRSTLGNLFTRRAGFEEGAFYDLAGVGDEDGNFLLPQLVDPRSFAPTLTNTEFFRNALEIARALLGPEATCWTRLHGRFATYGSCSRRRGLDSKQRQLRQSLQSIRLHGYAHYHSLSDAEARHWCASVE